MTEFDLAIASLFDRPQPDEAPGRLTSSILAAIDRRDRRRAHLLGAATLAGGAATVAIGATAVPNLLAMLPAVSITSITLAVGMAVAAVAAGVMGGARLLQTSET